MEEGLYTRNPPGEEDSASPEDKAPRVHGNKLKNKDSARRYYEQKLRTGKADNSMTPEEKQHRDKIKKQTQKKAAEVEKTRKAEEAKKKDRNVSKSSGNLSDAASKTAAGVGVMSDVVNSTDDGKGESAVAEEVFDIGGYVASGAVSHVTSKVKSGKYSKKVHGKRELSGGSTDAAKERARKELQRKMIQKQAKAAEGGAKFGEKVGEKTRDVVSAIGEWMKNFAEEHPVISIIVVLILLLVLVCAGFLNSCAAIGSGVGDVTIVTSYTAKDEDILAVEDDYKELEAGLHDEIDEIDTDGYDEVNYYLDEVGHNPYQLAAILTVIFEAYTRDEVQAKLQEIFELQYEITTEEVVETREREVEDVRWVEDDSYEDGGYWEEYTYTEEYEYYILNVYLVNHTLDEVVEELGFTDDEMARYEVLLETYGNKKYLFGEEDYYNIPDDHPGDRDDYHVPGEYLTDEQFARMLHEAESHLGTPYVWGGYSPSGFDCSGFVSWVINHCGNGWNFGRLTANGLRARTDYVPVSEAKPGDLIFFQGTYDTAGASHVGIYVGNGMMIHAGNPVKYSSINTPYWQSHFLEFGRIGG